MATAQLALDYAAEMTSFLLPEFLSRLTDPRLPPEEQVDLRMRFEYHLTRLATRAPGSAPAMLEPIQRLFAGAELTDRLVPTIEWYLEFVAGKDRRWHDRVDVAQIVRFFKEVPKWTVKERALRVILLVELSRMPDRPRHSRLARLFRDLPGLDGVGNVTEHGWGIAGLLIREVLTGPPPRPGEPNMSSFCLGVLRFCLADEGKRVPGHAIEQVLAVAGDIGTERRTEFQLVLSS